jgi:hypothetical protein
MAAVDALNVSGAAKVDERLGRRPAPVGRGDADPGAGSAPLSRGSGHGTV